MTYPLGSSDFLGFLLLSIWLTGLTTGFLWWSAGGQPAWQAVLLLVFSLGAGLVALSGLRSWVTTGELVWDGQHWRHETADSQTTLTLRRVSVMLDLQFVLVLKLEHQARAASWVWVQRVQSAHKWLCLRRALYALPKVAVSMSPNALGA